MLKRAALFLLTLILVCTTGQIFAGTGLSGPVSNENEAELRWGRAGSNPGGPYIPPEAWCAGQIGLAINVVNSDQRPDMLEYLDVGGPIWVRTLVMDGQHDKIGQLYDDYQGKVKILALVNQQSFSLATPSINDGQGVWDTYGENFGQQVVSLANNYGSKIGAFEIWNEPDDKDYFHPWQIAEVVNRTAWHLDNANHTHPVVVGGLSGPNWPTYLPALVEEITYPVEGYGFHPYTKTAGGIPSTGGTGTMEEAINTFRQLNGYQPIWITEFGLPMSPSNPDYEEQRQYLLNAYAIFKSYGPSVIPHAFWFAWDDRTHYEPHIGLMGLVTQNHDLRASGFGFKDLTRDYEESLPCSTWDGDIHSCVRHHTGYTQSCAWYSCSNKCLPRGTSFCAAGCTQYCNGSNEDRACHTFTTDTACDAADTGTQDCAWYACANNGAGGCRSRGTSNCEAGCSQYCCNPDLP